MQYLHVAEVVNCKLAFFVPKDKLIFVYNFLTLRKEFESHKVGHLVTVRCCDVCKEGFGLTQVADAGITAPAKNRVMLLILL